jgi:hypothetical protein
VSSPPLPGFISSWEDKKRSIKKKFRASSRLPFKNSVTVSTRIHDIAFIHKIKEYSLEHANKYHRT